MDRSYPYSRRLLSRARLRKRIAAVAGAGLVAATAVLMLTWKPDPVAAAVPAPFMPALALNGSSGAAEPLQRSLRRIYPYSVVPGGVSGQSELQRIIRTDRVVAAHYATFDAGKARSVVVDKPRAVHVSYRKGDKVYWTAHKVMLAPGETLLSDGRNEMRARCANRISDLPQYPVEAHRPAMAELDQAIELAEGEEYAFGPAGLPVAMAADGSIPRHVGMRFAARGATPANSALAATLASSASGMGPVTTLGLSGASSSMGSGPRPTSRPVASPEPEAPAAPEAPPEGGTGSIGGSSGAPSPDGGTPGGAPVGGEPVTNPLPDTSTTPGTPAPAPGFEAPLPGTNPGTNPAPGPVTQPQPVLPAPTPLPPAPPAPAPEPVLPKPVPEPLPPQAIVPPEPVEVPEPGSLWLFALALAAMGVLRRRRST